MLSAPSPLAFALCPPLLFSLRHAPMSGLGLPARALPRPPCARRAAVMRLADTAYAGERLVAALPPLLARAPLPPAQRLQLVMGTLVNGWMSLKLRPGDFTVSLTCLLLPGLILRTLYRVYRYVIRKVDPEGKRVFVPAEYEQSMFRTIERAGLLQIGGGLHIASILMKVMFAFGQRLHISDPVMATGGTPLRFDRLSTVCFWAYTLAKIKERLLLRGDLGAFKSGRQRFVLNRVMDVFIVGLVFFACCETIGLPLSSLAAAGGVGGLVVGLASKEIVENLFGGIELLFTSPFLPGDVVKTARFQGRVAKIGPYTTEIEDFDGGKALVPNSLITNQIITNFSRRTRSRFYSRYSLRYEDLKVVPAIVDAVRDGLLAHPLTISDGSGFMRSSLTSFGPYSLVLQAECLVGTGSKDAFLDYQQAALLLIAKVVEENGAEFETEFPKVPLRGDESQLAAPVEKKPLFPFYKA